MHKYIYLLAVCVIEHAVHDVLGQFGFIRVSSSAHPGVNNTLIVSALKRYLEKTHTVTQNQKGRLFLSLSKHSKSRRQHNREISSGTNYYIVMIVLQKKITLRMKQNSELRLLESVPI